MTIRICMWSGPRNLSTALMRSFENRSDCAVLDEPFFASYLLKSGRPHPGREETLAVHDTNPDNIPALCLASPPNNEPLYFQKHMPHHMIEGFDKNWMQYCQHFFLIRDPKSVITSYAKGIDEANLDDYFNANDLGYVQTAALYDKISGWQNAPPPVIDADDVLKDPERTLSALCNALNIDYQPEMLSWPAGSRVTDGAWAPYWYKNVEASTGFGLARKSVSKFPAQYENTYAMCQPAYEHLHKTRL